MINIPHPSRETAHFIARILAARQTPSDEVPLLITTLHRTIEALRTGAVPLESPALPEAADTVAVAPPVPRRGRRPRDVTQPPVRAPRHSEPPPPAPVVPQLMRRAEVAPISEPAPVAPQPVKSGTLRGIVRWFDINSRQGTLRLPGFGDELVIDARALERAGISRLYRGQEIEATVAADGDGVRLVGLALPGRAELGAHGVFKAGTARRNARPVIVELKRDAMRRTASRIEAEQILGSGRTDLID